MDHISQWIEKAGLTNKYECDLRDLISNDSRTVRSSFCSSYKCTGIVGEVSKKKWTRKYVPGNTMSCPDCKNILFWETKVVIQ